MTLFHTFIQWEASRHWSSLIIVFHSKVLKDEFEVSPVTTNEYNLKHPITKGAIRLANNGGD